MATSNQDRPTIVALCGSTLFREAYAQAFMAEEHAGRICLTVPCYKDDPCCKTDEERARLDRLRLAKIDLADEVLVLNVDGYLGESTMREIAYAKAAGKRVRYWEETWVILATRRGHLGAEVGVVRNKSDRAVGRDEDDPGHVGEHIASALKFMREAIARGHRARLAERNPGWCYTVMPW